MEDCRLFGLGRNAGDADTGEAHTGPSKDVRAEGGGDGKLVGVIVSCRGRGNEPEDGNDCGFIMKVEVEVRFCGQGTDRTLRSDQGQSPHCIVQIFI